MQSSAMAAVTPTLSMTLKYGDPVTHHKISSKFVKNFFLYHSNRQTDRQTDRHRVKHTVLCRDNNGFTFAIEVSK